MAAVDWPHHNNMTFTEVYALITHGARHAHLNIVILTCTLYNRASLLVRALALCGAKATP